MVALLRDLSAEVIFRPKSANTIFAIRAGAYKCKTNELLFSSDMKS